MNMTCQKTLLPQMKKKHFMFGNRKFYYTRAKGKDDYENYQVFQHKHIVYHQDIHIEEVDNHLETVYKLAKEDKDDYFMSNGLDYDRCYEYINIVKYLNRCLTVASKSDEKDNNKKEKFRLPGWSVIGVLAFIYYCVKDDW